MSFPLITPELIHRIERFRLRFNSARTDALKSLPGNPYGVGFFGTAGTVPEYRGRGVQMALLQRRLADAPRFGCDLVVGGGSLFSPPHRNFERAGLRLVAIGTGWQEGRW